MADETGGAAKTPVPHWSCVDGHPVAREGQGLVDAVATAGMDTSDAFVGLECVDTGARFDPDTARHPEGGLLDPVYDFDGLDLSPEALRTCLAKEGRATELLPFEPVLSMGEGGTPLVDCPALADELGVRRVLLKDEGANPTGTVDDRGFALAVTAAARHGATDVALAGTGNDAQSAAAYAARAGLDAHAFVPSRAAFVNKAMINVHGGDMTVVPGRLPDARDAARDALADQGPDSEDHWYSLDAFVTPYRHEGSKTLGYELLADLDFDPPDHVVYPFDGTGGFYGTYKAMEELRELGLVDDLPAFHAAQAEGCAPLVRAYEDGHDDVEPWDGPDTIGGTLEDPVPPGARLALDTIRSSGGRAVAASDPDILESAVAIASNEGVEAGVSTGAAAAAAWVLADEFDAADTVVLVNTTAGSKDADVLRSHLMGQGV